MTFDLVTLVKIRRRMELLACDVLFFHDIRTPERQSHRVRRIMNWLGDIGIAVTRPYALNRLLQPDDTRRVWKRHGGRNV